MRQTVFTIMLMVAVIIGGHGCATMPSITAADVTAFVANVNQAAQTGLVIYEALQSGDTGQAQSQADKYGAILNIIETSLAGATFLPDNIREMALAVITDGRAVLASFSGQKSAGSGPIDPVIAAKRLTDLKSAVATLRK